MIEPRKLTKKDIGRQVYYRVIGKKELVFGELIGWNHVFLFVRSEHSGTQSVRPAMAAFKTIRKKD